MFKAKARRQRRRASTSRSAANPSHAYCHLLPSTQCERRKPTAKGGERPPPGGKLPATPGEGGLVRPLSLSPSTLSSRPASCSPSPSLRSGASPKGDACPPAASRQILPAQFDSYQTRHNVKGESPLPKAASVHPLGGSSRQSREKGGRPLSLSPGTLSSRPASCSPSPSLRSGASPKGDA